ncbi:MAG: SurA N-terminal domain-containing protein [Phenylobacterium sp.]
MLANIRNFAKSWPAKILMGLLAISFVGWGIQQGGLGGVGGDQIIRAGDRVIDTPAFRREYDIYRKNIEQQSGQQITPELAQANSLDTVVLNGLATREAFAELLTKIGVRPGDKLLVAQIQKIPAFFDQITGKFDRATFERQLGQNGLTPERFDAAMRDEMASQHWGVAMQNGFAVPRAYGAMASAFALESRDLSYAILTPAGAPQPAAPTDAQLQAFINENKAQLTRPELRLLTVALFAPRPAEGPIDAAELQKRYDFRKDTFSQPETRTIVQIPVKTQATAQTVLGRLTKGEAPEAIAKSIGVEAVTFANRPKTAIADQKVGAAAFGMAAGQTATVQGDLGLAVVRVISVTPGRVVTLEEARPMLEAEIRKDMAAEAVYAQTQAYDDAHQGGASLADAARKAGGQVTQIGPITAQAQDLQGRQLQGLPPKVLEVAFALPSGADSELTELGEGAYFALRVERVIPAQVPPLAEIRPMVSQAWIQREVIRALEARAATLSSRISTGESLEAAAAAMGASVSRAPALSRQTAGARQDLGNDVLGRTFNAKSGEVFTARAPNGVLVGRVDNIRLEPGPAAAQIAEASRGQLSQAIFQEMSQAAQVYARAKLKVKTDPARARTALGFEPAPEPGQAAPKK